ncbi:hypothetical protein Tco_0802932 [Tanacetum coccineum]|uniref:Retrotransposon protein, putative, Ty1-copia subclass n=1 Tax=Tanacetum coccineum TaxID=301880 RepID=A0ABQ5A070_9ASTR
MENSKRGSIPMQDKLRLSKSQGASTPAELKRMQSVPYASAVGSIMYAVRCTRPDVAFAQNITSRFQQNPGDLHWTTVKNILKYLRINKGTCFLVLSETGYVFVLNGGVVDWKSAKPAIFFYFPPPVLHLQMLSNCCFFDAFYAKPYGLGNHFWLEKVHTDDNIADPFTKALAFPKHSELTRNIGMLPASSFM